MAKMTKKPKSKAGADKAGPDGTIVQTRRMRTGTQAIATMKVRCRPGTFEWRYGAKGNAQYHAGAEFARLWERAGIASCGQQGLGGASGGEGARGLPDARVQALDRAQAISRILGSPMTRRLVAYCVEGQTPKEIGGGLVSDERAMAHVLEVDLIELARAMGFSA